MNVKPSRWRSALLVVAAAAILTPLTVGCGGSGSPKADSSSSPGSVQKLDEFAQCMRNHGVANFYFTHRSNPASTPSPGNGVVLVIRGFEVTGVNPQTQQFQTAMTACRNVLGLHPPSAALQHKQLNQELKAAACMRAHGYPGWPDPSAGPNGGVWDPGAPAGVDTSSPQFQAAAKKCGES